MTHNMLCFILLRVKTYSASQVNIIYYSYGTITSSFALIIVFLDDKWPVYSKDNYKKLKCESYCKI